MNSFFARFLAVIACVHLLGGHWSALQVVAWGGMLWDSLHEKPLITALSETFDGAHPCSLCDSIAEGREEEGEKKPFLSESKTLAVLSVAARLPALSAMDLSYPDMTCSAGVLALSQASPPPQPGQTA